MTARLPFTQARVRRAIAAAEKAGLQVIGIKADGTLLVQRAGKPTDSQLTPLAPDGDDARWQEVEA